MNVLDSALYSRLQTTSGITSLLSGTVSIYHLQAPNDAVLPYLVYSLQADNEPNDSSHRIKDSRVFVRAYATGSTGAAQAGSINAAVDTALHLIPLTVSGWADLWMAREQELELVETKPNGQQVYMSGGIYKVLLEKV